MTVSDCNILYKPIYHMWTFHYYILMFVFHSVGQDNFHHTATIFRMFLNAVL